MKGEVRTEEERHGPTISHLGVDVVNNVSEQEHKQAD
jgi:hypothetical protein